MNEPDTVYCMIVLMQHNLFTHVIINLSCEGKYSSAFECACLHAFQEKGQKCLDRFEIKLDVDLCCDLGLLILQDFLLTFHSCLSLLDETCAKSCSSVSYFSELVIRYDRTGCLFDFYFCFYCIVIQYSAVLRWVLYWPCCSLSRRWLQYVLSRILQSDQLLNSY